MEINTQQMEALLHLQEQQAQLPRKNNGQASGFDELLSRQLESMNPGQAASGAASAGAAQPVYNQPLADAIGGAGMSNDDTAALNAAFDNAAGALNLWDSYARTLGSSRGDTALRDAYAILEDIDAQVAQWRDSGTRGQNPGLDAILNELEVMAATERFKFNRGDYL